MKITRHTATDMRQALRMVREQLGPDAVIMSSRRTKRGVEVTAAVDFDAEQFEARAAELEAQAAQFDARAAQIEALTGMPAPRSIRGGTASASGKSQQTKLEAQTSPSEARPFHPEEFSPPPSTPARPEHDPYTIADVHQSSYARIHAAIEAEAASKLSTAEVTRTATAAVATATVATAAPANVALVSAAAADEATSIATPIATTPSATDEMGNELKTLRRILETQLAQLAWNDLSRRAPIHTQILRELTEIGLTQDFAAQVVAQLPAQSDIIHARRLSIALVSQRLPVTGDRWLDAGGRVALVGPTGVGKTTALAKLAVRWVLRHGPRSLALVSADSVRIGAHDQIQALGQMLDVPVHIADSFAEIPSILENLAQKRFVLIDTPGSSQREAQLSARMAELAAAGSNIETALVLSASTQAGAIDETVRRFATAKAASCLLTKVDEAASLGGVLSVLTRAQLPISYVSEGQRVPEDLRPARALELVTSAVQLAKSSGAAADEDLLTRRYGDVAHALA